MKKKHHLDTHHIHTKKKKIKKSLDFLFVFSGCLDVFSLRPICKLNIKISRSKLTSYSKTGWRFPLFAQHGEHQLLLYKWCVVISEGCGKTVEFKDYLPACFSTKLNQIMGSFHGFQIESSRKLAGERRGKKGNCRYEYMQNQNVSFPPQSTLCPLKRARGYLFGLSI